MSVKAASPSDEFVQEVLRRVREVKEKADKALGEKERPSRTVPIKYEPKPNGVRR